MEDGVTLEAPAVQPEAIIQPEVAAPIATMMERPRRPHRQPVHHQDYKVNLDDEVDDNGDLVHFSFLADSELMRLADVIQHPKWQEAMNEELMAIEKNNAWQLTDLPKGHKAIDVKWLYKIKVKANGEIDRYKARLVAKGFEQREGYDYEEIISLVARIETVRLIIALAAQRKWKIHQMDVKSAFLNGPLDEEVYVKQSPGFIQSGKEEKVYILTKACLLYTSDAADE